MVPMLVTDTASTGRVYHRGRGRRSVRGARLPDGLGDNVIRPTGATSSSGGMIRAPHAGLGIPLEVLVQPGRAA